MRRGEKVILSAIALVSVALMLYQAFSLTSRDEKDPGIPFYSTAATKVQRQASGLYRKYKCRDCHTLWGTRNIMQAVPAPSLDGIGSLRSEDWLYSYFSAENPQAIVPSRLKPRFRMPSFAALPESERRLLARYFASLKVEDWYLKEVQKSEYEKLTGNDAEP